MTIRRLAAMLLPLLCAACGSSTPSSPSTTGTTAASVAPASLSETYGGTLPIAGAKFYSFTVVQNGTVNVTLASLDGPDITADTTVDLAIGKPAGFGCTPQTSATVSTGTAPPHVTGTFAPGVYCARIADMTGILPAAAAFSISIEHS